MTPKSLEYARMLDNRKPRYVEEGEPVRIKCYDTVNANNAFTQIFTRETERLFAKVLNLALDNEVQAEAMRQRLSRRPLFNLFDAFKTIDKYDQGFIVLEDLKDILADNGIFATTTDAKLLLDQFTGGDKQTEKISYSEFVKELSPKSNRVY